MFFSIKLTTILFFLYNQNISLEIIYINLNKNETLYPNISFPLYSTQNKRAYIYIYIYIQLWTIHKSIPPEYDKSNTGIRTDPEENM